MLRNKLPSVKRSDTCILTGELASMELVQYMVRQSTFAALGPSCSYVLSTAVNLVNAFRCGAELASRKHDIYVSRYEIRV